MTDYTIFETPRGWMAIGYTGAGLCRLILPTPNRELVERELAEEMGACSKAGGELYTGALTRYFAGEPVELDLPVDWKWATPFQQQVLKIVKQIPYGQVETYGSIARRLGKPLAARAVGSALARNRVPVVIPCHRVLAAGGKALGGFTSRDGLKDKIALLTMEGVKFGGEESAASD
ncbi:MAG TPA: methylated-DNA--[protein]-cysteine S-methyltransferase [Desulfobacteria bacterium]|nr:methylated-DNA--[protein]-cysteine S-methyltransferase [Desulfobacteria bacterium]